MAGAPAAQVPRAAVVRHAPVLHSDSDHYASRVCFRPTRTHEKDSYIQQHHRFYLMELAQLFKL